MCVRHGFALVAVLLTVVLWDGHVCAYERHSCAYELVVLMRWLCL